MEVLGIIKNEKTPKITTGETMFTITGSDSHRGGGMQLSYQKVTGSLMANSHPGSYCGQDAYNDMFVVERNDEFFDSANGSIQRIRAGTHSCRARLQECNRLNFRGGDELKTVVRRLTPEECELLQGFEMGYTNIGQWTDTKGKVHKESSDSARYKALGNSIALPFWKFLARRIAAQYEREITMGSLFDGIGGFPLAFEKAGAKAVWASEIEEFPIAVTKRHFPEEGEKGDNNEEI